MCVRFVAKLGVSCTGQSMQVHAVASSFLGCSTVASAETWAGRRRGDHDHDCFVCRVFCLKQILRHSNKSIYIRYY